MAKRKEYFLVDHDNTGEGLTPEEMEKYFKHFNVKGTPTGKSDQMGDEFDIEGDDEAMSNFDKDVAAMVNPAYCLPWEDCSYGGLPAEDKYLPELFEFGGQSIVDPRYDSTVRFTFDTPEDSIKEYGEEYADKIRQFYKDHPWQKDETPDDPDESSEKPHDEELAGEKTPEEDFMERAAAGEVPATSGVLAGDLTPEEIEMIQMMRAGKQPPKSKELAGETTPEEKEMLKLAGNQTLSDERFKNITNRLAKNLSKHRW